ncbi:unnamed protein product [Lepeophtheirus salmonis]|uniref:(salmon louse) hypothetical protein n=1 Tax=Lepeophtheirus salmonis TaxID=72036 RepID=A0A7R8CSV9_LEPSM|nr:unnamed protein product [Lepeophtheirus salmonis]CAF2920772.1 unnamed protein product [Lepeophtheirus salmonis]
MKFSPMRIELLEGEKPWIEANPFLLQGTNQEDVGRCGEEGPSCRRLRMRFVNYTESRLKIRRNFGGSKSKKGTRIDDHAAQDVIRFYGSEDMRKMMLEQKDTYAKKFTRYLEDKGVFLVDSSAVDDTKKKTSIADYRHVFDDTVPNRECVPKEGLTSDKNRGENHNHMFESGEDCILVDQCISDGGGKKGREEANRKSRAVYLKP